MLLNPIVAKENVMLKKLCISLGLIFSALVSSVTLAQVCGDGGQFLSTDPWTGANSAVCVGGSQGNRSYGTNVYDGVGAPAGGTNTAGSQGGFANTPRVTIVNKYGAVAWNNHGGFDSAFGKDSQIEANHEALSKCGSDCRITTTYANQCAAMAYGASKVNKKVLSGSLNVSDNYRVAERGALAKCSLKADNCKLWLSECSTMNDSSSKM
jgi:hypothetical protein